jgi:hypothetical protein
LDYTVTRRVIFSPAVRYFTDQASFDNATGEFMTIHNRFYVDAAVTVKDVIRKETDLHIVGQNIFDNRDPVGGQWLRDTYNPRGATLVVSLDMKF